MLPSGSEMAKQRLATGQPFHRKCSDCEEDKKMASVHWSTGAGSEVSKLWKSKLDKFNDLNWNLFYFVRESSYKYHFKAWVRNK